MSWREQIVRFARVPPPPAAPPGEGRPLVFRAADNYLRFRQAVWFLQQLGALAGLLFGLAFVHELSERAGLPLIVQRLMLAGEAIAAVVFILQIPFSWGIAILDYEMRWYITTDRSLRIREGILHVQEKTMAFANIQNISIRQGPLQRLLGIADVEVRNAGGGGESAHEKKGAQSEPMHVGYFRGVDNAEAIRDLLREGVRRQKDAGLGDPDEPAAADPEVTDVNAALEILENLRAARIAVTRESL